MAVLRLSVRSGSARATTHVMLTRQVGEGSLGSGSATLELGSRCRWPARTARALSLAPHSILRSELPQDVKQHALLSGQVGPITRACCALKRRINGVHRQRPQRVMHRALKQLSSGLGVKFFYGAPMTTLTELPVRASSGTV